jgi:DNA replication protein DnaC
VARLSGGYTRLLNKIARFQLLVLDDFALVPISEEQCRDLLEVTDDRCGLSSMILGSQLKVKEWYQTFANPTLADAILDRVVHESYRIDLDGGSRRKEKGNTDTTDENS